MDIKNREWQIFQTIGKTGDGLDVAFRWISGLINPEQRKGYENIELNDVTD